MQTRFLAEPAPLLSTRCLILLLLTLLVLLSHTAIAADILVSVDRQPVNLDESFKILFTANENPDNEPDLSPLEKDFSIINHSQSSSSSWVNGDYQKSVRWSIEVTAKRAGNLVIPAIAFGNDVSKPMTIEVKQAAPTTDPAKSNNDEIFLEVKAEPEQPYVQSQVMFTIRLYRRVDIAQAELSEPELADAVIEKLGEDSNYTSVVNGMSYQVTERKYAIFPQKSGEMKIKPLSLTAQVVMLQEPDFRDFFGSRMTKTKRVLSREITLHVKPAPADFTGKDWLVAEKLEFNQDWSGDIQQMKVGEPLTRTLTLRGDGITVGQLPELNKLKTDAKIKAYPDQPVLNEQKLVSGLSASRQEKIALIPAAPGQHTLPAVEIPWFNSKTQTMEIVRIPETTINVVGASTNQAQTTTSKPSPGQATATAKIEDNKPESIVNNGQDNIWIWLSAFLALGWLSTSVFFLRKLDKQAASRELETVNIQHEDSINKSVKKLKKACVEDNATAAKDALLIWGKLNFNADNLAAIATHCEARLRDELIALNQALYSKDAGQWTGKKLLQTFAENKARGQVSGNKAGTVLEPLHRL